MENIDYQDSNARNQYFDFTIDYHSARSKLYNGTLIDNKLPVFVDEELNSSILHQKEQFFGSLALSRS